MSEHSKHEDSEESEDMEQQAGPVDSEVVGLLKKMQQQLVYLEKKIDTLLAGGQSAPRSFNRSGGGDRDRGGAPGGRFSRGPRPFGNAPWRGKDRGESGPPRERSFGHGRPSFDRPRTGGGGGERDRGGFSGGPKRKPFFRRERE